MAGQRYDQREYPGRGYDRHSFGEAGYEMGPGWGWRDERDPNWRGGGYHGLRMGGGGARYAGYGRHRFFHQYDLGGHGGFEGRYDLPEGWWDRDGLYHEQYEPAREVPRARRVGVPPRPGGPERGGVQYGRDYLAQYNSRSPGLRGEGPPRGWGYAPGPREGSYRGTGPHDWRTDERGYAGYNSGGFAEGHHPGPGTRQAYPPQKGRR